MVGVTVAFVANGLLLRYVALKWLYAIGLVLQSASYAALFAAPELSLTTLAPLGLICGSMAALYWGNRNLLSLQMTQGSERDYFCSFESAFATLLSVVSPAVFGWFLQVGTHAQEEAIVLRYQILTAIMVAIQVAGAWYIVRAPFDDYTPSSIVVTKASSFWNQARLFTALKGVADGSALFLPTLVVMRLIGEEGALGTLQSLATVITSALMYGLARWMRGERRHRVLASGVGIMVVAGLVLSVWYSSIGGIGYIILQALSIQLIWAAANPIILDAINFDQQRDGDSYRYVVDRELFLNIGRMTGVFIVLVLNYFSDDDVTLRITPIVLALATSFMLVSSRDLSRKTG
jgi:YQGE family putative transporter